MKNSARRKTFRDARAFRVLGGIALALALASASLALLPVRQAHAYTYQKTDTSTVFNRCWIMANPSGYLEFIGSDPHGPRAYMPSFEQPGGWNGRVSSYQFSVANARTLNWTDYTVANGTWSRGGAVFGHGRLDASSNGSGFGCVATYGYGWGGTVASRFGGLDELIYAHVYITDTVYGRNYYGAADFWPRVSIRYDANGGVDAPAAQYKYIGAVGTISATKPTRTGYTFEGWSTSRNGAVGIAPGQRIGYEDWNLKKHMAIAHDWDSGPVQIYDDAATGQPSPTGTNVITLYAVWKPVSYAVAYQGNGSTAGSTAPSSHVYDAPKTLAANGFKRFYTLACNAQGGSSGDKTLVCSWGWRSWNTAAGGTGVSYANRANVLNLRSSAGTVALYAQWDAGSITLPDPGRKNDCRFKGWYTASSGGVLVGEAGASVSIDRNTTYYAQWEQLVSASYYVDGSDIAVFSERVAVGSAYAASAEASRRGAKENCAGFDGWYLDVACTQAYADGAVVAAGGLRLYGRNSVLLRYEATERSSTLLSERTCFLDEALDIPLTAPEAVLPSQQVLYYGDRVSFERGPSVWFEAHGKAREATCDRGAYATAAAEGPPASSMRLTGNAVAYLNWSVPVYDGIEIS